MQQNNFSALYKIVLEKIKQTPKFQITFAEYMDLVLYHPEYGYYSSGVVEIGAKGDFFTAVSLGSDFGELLAIQFQEMWHNLGCPNPFYLIEMGAGSGDLARDIINYLQIHCKDLVAALEYIIIEKSPSLIKRQQSILNELDGVNLKWQSWKEVLDNSLIGCCFSNELIDAFPVHQLVFYQGSLQEVYLTEKQGKITEVYDKLSTKKLQKYFELVEINFSSQEYSENYRTEVNLTALDWLDTVAKKINIGYLLTIDYGYTAPKYYHPQRNQGTLQCYYQHRRHHNPYVNLGQQDITTHVDFTALQNYGQQLALETIGITKSAMFLMALGLGDRLNQLSSGQYNIIEILQRRDALHQLINPLGLGGFEVLIQGKNLTKQQHRLQGLQESF